MNRQFSEIAVDFPHLRDLGVTSLVLSGGEPSSRFTLPEIVQYATRYFQKVTVISNGANLDTLQKILGYAEIWISLDYYGVKQDAWRGFNGLWQNYLKLAKTANVRSTLMNDNLEDVKTLVKTVSDNKKQITIVPYRGGNIDLCATASQLKQLISYIFRNSYDETAVIDDPNVRAWIIAQTGQQHKPQCSACEGTMRVTVKGTVTPCPFLDKIICDLYDPQIKEKLSKAREEILNTFTGKCRECPRKMLCGGCKASGNEHCIF